MIKYSIEKLLHMQCSGCDSYWTIGDKEPEGVMICPSCADWHDKWEEMEPLNGSCKCEVCNESFISGESMEAFLRSPDYPNGIWTEVLIDNGFLNRYKTDNVHRRHVKCKTDPLQNLFDGCPVMVVFSDDKKDQPRYYKETDYYINGACDYVCYDWRGNFYTTKNTVKYSIIRLPTIEESPRNTWLAHSGEDTCPEGAEELSGFLWFKDDEWPVMFNYMKGAIDWKNVERLMILEK